MPPGGGKGTAVTRIKKEIAALAKEDTGDIKLTPDESNIFSWKCTIPGPSQSPYEGGVFDVDVRIPDDYPFSPPHLQFLTKVYHCNIASTGAICLDIIKNNWSPALSLYKVILSLSSLLTDPNPADPLVPAIAQELKRNKKKHDETAREWVQLYALPKKTETKTVPPPAPARTTSSTSASRRTIHRPSASNSPAPTPVAGTRRRNPFADEHGGSSSRVIEVQDSDSDSDMQVLEDVSSHRANGAHGANGANEIEGVNGQDQKARDERKAKRAKTNATGRGTGGGGSADDVIVIDD